MPADEDATAQFQAEHAALLVALSEAIERAWFSLGSWNDPDVPRFVELAHPLSTAARLRIVELVDAYTSLMSSTPPVGLTDLLADFIEQPRDLPPEDVWRRPFITQWSGLANGQQFTVANAQGSIRAVTIAGQDMQAATRQAMTTVVEVHADLPDEVFELAPRTPTVQLPTLEDLQRLEAPETASIAPESASDEPDGESPAETFEPRRIVGYRRVLSGKSCMFCAAASTRIYGGPNLLPLHARCDCSIAPVFDGSDPGASLNGDLLRELKKRGPDYWKARGFVDNDGRPLDPTKIPEHLGSSSANDEIGPVLANA